MKKTNQLLFALRNEQWVHVSEVPRGRACACECPACNASLVAKKGQQNQHHFAHQKGHLCSLALETSLHRLGKAIIVEKKSLYTPLLEAYRSKLLRKGRLETYQKAQEETRLRNTQVDVLLQNGNSKLGVEIKVTHPTGKQKIRRLAQLNLPTVEIDMLRIYEQHLLHYPQGDLKQLVHTLLYGTQNRVWLFHPWQHRYEYKLAQTATPRKVHINKQGNYYHYHVYHCPRNLRFVRRGFREGYSYARIFQDCLHCQHCRKINYQQEFVGYHNINTLPAEVLCDSEAEISR
ncbi:competence protein CoiA family protein [Lewinella cohaerens]|uniref:competence protein CoiA family protein n=1 Tax=Lewinella cohaerens TaxID=70995 RepID=UPI00039C8BC0|nr:competence protein CoiA family protein [Lewinella cohaerens]